MIPKAVQFIEGALKKVSQGVHCTMFLCMAWCCPSSVVFCRPSQGCLQHPCLSMIQPA